MRFVEAHNEPGRLLLGLESGHLINHSDFKSNSNRKIFFPFGHELSGSTATSVSALSSSPLMKDLFCVGYASGEVRLFSSLNRDWCALKLWSFSNTIISIAWSPVRASVFYMLDCHGLVRVMDILDDTESVWDSHHIESDDQLTRINTSCQIMYGGYLSGKVVQFVLRTPENDIDESVELRLHLKLK